MDGLNHLDLIRCFVPYLKHGVSGAYQGFY